MKFFNTISFYTLSVSLLSLLSYYIEYHTDYFSEHLLKEKF